MRIAPIACLALLACSPQRGPGEPCRDGDCAEGSVCARVLSGGGDGIDECIALCDAPVDLQPGRCGGGELCYPARVDRPELWGCFPGGDVALGEACTYPTDCVRGAFCRFSGEPPVGECIPGCGIGGCSRGEACIDVFACSEGLLCVLLDGVTDGECLATCEPSSGGTPYPCDDGSVCWQTTGRDWVCWPGGSTPLGAACSDVAACERGTICAGDPPDARCVRVCDEDADCGDRCVDGLCLR